MKFQTLLGLIAFQENKDKMLSCNYKSIQIFVETPDWKSDFSIMWSFASSSGLFKVMGSNNLTRCFKGKQQNRQK